MSAETGNTDENFDGDERRDDEESNRRDKPDPRKGIRFDTEGGDRRSGFARRRNDDGLRDSDFE